MADLGIPQNTIEILRRHNFRFQKKFGQNFLIDTFVLDKIITAAEITDDDYVLEIGPGIGTLTQFLCENAKKVLCVEIDRKLIPILDETLSGYENVTVLNEDIMKIDIEQITHEFSGGKPIKVVANLPYYITTPIIMKLFESRIPLKSVTVMVQKEVALRMQAKPDTKDYGALSLAVGYYSDVKFVANVPENCFLPRPTVGSAVVCLKCHEKPPVDVVDERLMFQIIRASFNQRRKTLQNGIGNDSSLPFTKEMAKSAIEGMGLSASVRGETLSLSQFAELSNRLAR